MAKAQPFLIANFKTAKSIGLEPWLSPIDAFPVLENMVVDKGVLQKRLGYSPFATMKHGSTTKTDTPVIGIHTYLRKGMPNLLIFDNRRCNLYDPIDASMTDISSDLDTPADIFTCSSSDYTKFCNWRQVGYVTNNVDQIHQWQGLGHAVVPFNIQVNSDTKTNHIDTCQYIFIIDDRMVLLGTTEFGDWYPQRLRYGPVLQTDFTQSGGGTDDAETQERICAAGMIGKTVYAFFEGPGSGSLWRIRRTGNTAAPLEWERITSTEGSRSPHSGIEYNDGLVAIGLSNVLFYDGYQVKRLELPAVRDVFSEFNDAYIRQVFGYNQRETDQRHLLFTFADASSSAIDRVLDYNVVENNWTVHKSTQTFFLNCIGGFNGQKVPTVDQLDDVYTGADGALVSAMTVDSRAVLGTPKPYTLIGCRNSQVYKWNDGEYDGTDDTNGKIAIAAESSRWNPFVDRGKKLACVKIGFLVDNDSDASFTVSAYKNTSTTAYATKSISCDGSDDKFWAYMFCGGEVGNFHRIKISHTEKGNTPKIHAIMPFFAPSGGLDL